MFISASRDLHFLKIFLCMVIDFTVVTARCLILFVMYVGYCSYLLYSWSMASACDYPIFVEASVGFCKWYLSFGLALCFKSFFVLDLLHCFLQMIQEWLSIPPSDILVCHTFSYLYSHNLLLVFVVEGYN